MVKIDDLLLNSRFRVDDIPHITLNRELCDDCAGRHCAIVCPAGCFVVGDGNGIEFSYASCLECGSCRVVCSRGAIEWNYPRGGFGICYCLS